MTIERALDERTIGHNPERMCLLKGGLIYSNAVTTVSPTYAKEVRGGGGGFLSKHIVAVEDKFSGIVNGIDDDIWNPLTDPYLPANFSARNPQNKAVCKKFVQRGLGMRETEGQRVPLVVCISRLVPQKGVGLIEHAIRHTKAKGGQFVLLGTGGSDAPLRAMAAQLKDDPDVKFVFAFSDELSHHLFGAADMILVPSIFEPCGLTQLLGQRYGAVPVVRRTGGLADTVDPNPESGTGFVFDGQGAPDVQRALDEAVGAYADAARWDALVKRCMTKDNRRVSLADARGCHSETHRCRALTSRCRTLLSVVAAGTCRSASTATSTRRLRGRRRRMRCRLPGGARELLRLLLSRAARFSAFAAALVSLISAASMGEKSNDGPTMSAGAGCGCATPEGCCASGVPTSPLCSKSVTTSEAAAQQLFTVCCRGRPFSVRTT